MTRKHFIAVAEVLAAERSLAKGNPGEIIRINNIMHSLADVFAQANQHFNRQRFYAACGA